MFDPQKLLQQVLGGGAEEPGQGKGGFGISKDTMKGAALGGIAGLLLGSKGGRQLAGSALQVGGVAVLGGLAYTAWKNWQAQKAGGAPDVASPPAPDAKFIPGPAPERNELGLTLLSAMIAAAKADGHIDAAEQARIFAKAGESGLSAEEKGYLMDEFAKPLDLEAIAAKATTPERAAEIYAASRLAIDVDHERETGYLDALARRLGLEAGLRGSIDAEVRKALVPA